MPGPKTKQNKVLKSLLNIISSGISPRYFRHAPSSYFSFCHIPLRPYERSQFYQLLSQFITLSIVPLVNSKVYPFLILSKLSLVLKNVYPSSIYLVTPVIVTNRDEVTLSLSPTMTGMTLSHLFHLDSILKNLTNS